MNWRFGGLRGLQLSSLDISEGAQKAQGARIILIISWGPGVYREHNALSPAYCG
jgi:hypothetical protein